MIAFDADVLSEIWRGHAGYQSRAAQISAREQAIPIIVIEEILRGRLHSIRQAEAAKSKLPIESAYELFERTLSLLRQLSVLSYSAAAETLYQDWKRQKLRVGTHDLRIAAICVVNSATLVSRNRRDFDCVPGLSLAIWA